MKMFPLNFSLAGIRNSLFQIFINRLTHILLGLAAAYWLLALVLPGKDLIEMMGLIAIGIYSAAAVRWFPSALRSVREGDTSGVAQLLIGVTFFMASAAVLRIWALLWRWSNYAPWMTESPWLGFLLLSSVVGAAMMITSPGAANGTIPAQNWKTLAFAFAIGGILIGFMLRSAVEPKIDIIAAAVADGHERCVGMPIWGLAEERTYYGAANPKRVRINPTACFRNYLDAEAAGFKPHL